MSTHHTSRQPTSRGLRRWIAAGLAGVALAAAVALPAAAAAPAQVDDELGPRVERLCDRVPNLQLRTANVIERLEGDADTLGSLAWLEVKIGEAETRGRTELVTVLTNRLAVRTDTLAVLHQRTEGLVQLEAWCVEHGV